MQTSQFSPQQLVDHLQLTQSELNSFLDLLSSNKNLNNSEINKSIINLNLLFFQIHQMIKADKNNFTNFAKTKLNSINRSFNLFLSKESNLKNKSGISSYFDFFFNLKKFLTLFFDEKIKCKFENNLFNENLDFKNKKKFNLNFDQVETFKKKLNSKDNSDFSNFKKAVSFENDDHDDKNENFDFFFDKNFSFDHKSDFDIKDNSTTSTAPIIIPLSPDLDLISFENFNDLHESSIFFNDLNNNEILDMDFNNNNKLDQYLTPPEGETLLSKEIQQFLNASSQQLSPPVSIPSSPQEPLNFFSVDDLNLLTPSSSPQLLPENLFNNIEPMLIINDTTIENILNLDYNDNNIPNLDTSILDNNKNDTAITTTKKKTTTLNNFFNLNGELLNSKKIEKKIIKLKSKLFTKEKLALKKILKATKTTPTFTSSTTTPSKDLIQHEKESKNKTDGYDENSFVEIIKFSLENGKFNYACPICKSEEGDYSKVFTRPFNLKSHYISQHTDKREYGCSICNLKFVRRHDLQRHLKLHT
ncbi:hypothetical protein HK099_002074, partial [Clydaea vesicula]